MAIQSAKEHRDTLEACFRQGRVELALQHITARDDAIRAAAEADGMGKAAAIAADCGPGGESAAGMIRDAAVAIRARAPSPAQSLAPAAGER